MNRLWAWLRRRREPQIRRIIVAPSGMWASIALTESECEQINHLVEVRETSDGLPAILKRENILRVWLMWEVPSLESVFRNR